MSTSTSPAAATDATDWAALVANVQSATRARMVARGDIRSRPAVAVTSTQGPRTLASQKNMDWRADVHAFKFEVFEPTAWDAKGHHLTGTRAR